MRAFACVLLATLTGCGSMADAISYASAQASWADQPPGARSAFVRCVYEVSADQCGTSDIHHPAVNQCMKDQVMSYRSAEEKEPWLTERGCDRERAKLRKSEI